MFANLETPVAVCKLPFNILLWLSWLDRLNTEYSPAMCTLRHYKLVRDLQRKLLIIQLVLVGAVSPETFLGSLIGISGRRHLGVTPSNETYL